MIGRLRPALETALGSEVVGIVRVGGGDINESYDVHLSDGRRVFAKANPHAPPGFFEVEAAGLGWLAETGTVRVPRVLAAGDQEVHFLAMEWIEPGPHTPEADETLGRELAALHRSGAPHFGWDRDGYVGELPQPNGACESWTELYRVRRLEPLARRAVEAGLLPADGMAEFELLFARLPGLVGPPEPPARLHGDLWGGNLVVGRDGAPWLVDPAPYGGHREVDLAMMRLFGGFGSRAFAAYDEVFPLADGHLERVHLYQLYPLLVHVALFGAGYTGQVLDALHRYL